MRIGLDVTNFYFGLTSGTPIYLYNLLLALPAVAPKAEFHLLYNHRITPAARQILSELTGPRVKVLRTSYIRDGVPNGGWWYFRHASLRRLMKDLDVFHAGDFLWPRRGPVPIVASILDLTTRLYPESHHWANRWRDGKKLRWACATAERLIAISEATKRDLVRVLDIDADRIDVAPLARGLGGEATAVDPERAAGVRRRYGIGDAPYVLMVGTLEPRKNHVRLIRAFEGLPESLRHVRLVLAGGRGWKMEEIERALASSASRDRIHHLDFVPAADLRALYAGATVFAYPSLYEGFGLPVLEAMAAGAPVLTSNRSSLPEVAGDAAILVDPTSVEEIRSGLDRLLTQPALRAHLARLGREREREFTWRRTAERTLESYRNAVAARRAADGEPARR